MLKIKKTDTTLTSDWPDIFYEEFDPVIRHQLLEKHMTGDERRKEDQSQADLFRRKLLHRRYIQEKQGNRRKYTDLFTRTWMMMKISADQGAGFLQKRRIVKEWCSLMTDLCISNFTCGNEMEHDLLLKEWKAFFFQYIRSCGSDKIYGSTLFGIMPLKEDSVSEKIAAELIQITKSFPEKLGLAEEFTEFRQCAFDAYKAYTHNELNYFI